MNADNICEKYSENSVNLTIRLLEEDDGSSPTVVLVEGSSRALRMLAELLVATVEDEHGDGFSISPFGAGRVHFSPKSELGIYIHHLKD